MRTGHCHIGDAKSRTESPPIWTDRRRPEVTRRWPVAAEHDGKQDCRASLMTEKFQCGEDSCLTDDQHPYPFEQINLVGLHRRQQLTLESDQFAPEGGNVALGSNFFTQRLIEAI